jgi:prepilin-type processing-associated H-X9-DG protein
MRRIDVLIATLVALLVMLLVFPLVLRARRAEQQKLCTLNLKIIGMGTCAYRDSNNWADPTATFPNASLPPEERLSWLVVILPYTEKEDVYWRLDKSRGWQWPANQEVARGPFGRFVCPANPDGGDPNAPGLTDYIGVSGVGEGADRLPITDPRAGYFASDRVLRLADFKRGTSHTMLAVETTRDNGPWIAGGEATVRGFRPDRGPFFGRDGQFGSHHVTMSFTPQGPTTNVAFADGSVRQFTASADPQVVQRLATLAGTYEGED